MHAADLSIIDVCLAGSDGVSWCLCCFSASGSKDTQQRRVLRNQIDARQAAGVLL